MAGNMADWVADWYEKSFYGQQTTDPFNDLYSGERVVRGGSWANGESMLRVHARDKVDPVDVRAKVGIRCCWSP